MTGAAKDKGEGEIGVVKGIIKRGRGRPKGSGRLKRVPAVRRGQAVKKDDAEDRDLLEDNGVQSTPRQTAETGNGAGNETGNESGNCLEMDRRVETRSPRESGSSRQCFVLALAAADISPLNPIKPEWDNCHEDFSMYQSEPFSSKTARQGSRGKRKSVSMAFQNSKDKGVIVRKRIKREAAACRVTRRTSRACVNYAEGVESEFDSEPSTVATSMERDRPDSLLTANSPQMERTSEFEEESSPCMVETPFPYPSSSDIHVSGLALLDFFSVYNFLRSFSQQLYLSPFTLQAFSKALDNPQPNSLMDCLHVMLLRALQDRVEDMVKNPSAAIQSSLRRVEWSRLDEVTWPEYVVVYLAASGFTRHRGKNFSKVLAFSVVYYQLPVSVKLAVLSFLCDDLLENRRFRAEMLRRMQAEGSTEEIDQEVGQENELRVEPVSHVLIGRNSTRKRGRPRKVGKEGKHGIDDIEFSSRDPGTSDIDGNLDECILCGMDGHLICCDGCPAAFHSRCVGAAKHLLPLGDWYCPECEVEKRSELGTKMPRGFRMEKLGIDSMGRSYWFICDHVLIVEGACRSDPQVHNFPPPDFLKILHYLQSGNPSNQQLISAFLHCWETSSAAGKAPPVPVKALDVGAQVPEKVTVGASLEEVQEGLDKVQDDVSRDAVPQNAECEDSKRDGCNQVHCLGRSCEPGGILGTTNNGIGHVSLIMNQGSGLHYQGERSSGVITLAGNGGLVSQSIAVDGTREVEMEETGDEDSRIMQNSVENPVKEGTALKCICKDTGVLTCDEGKCVSTMVIHCSTTVADETPASCMNDGKRCEKATNTTQLQASVLFLTKDELTKGNSMKNGESVKDPSSKNQGEVSFGGSVNNSGCTTQVFHDGAVVLTQVIESNVTRESFSLVSNPGQTNKVAAVHVQGKALSAHGGQNLDHNIVTDCSVGREWINAKVNENMKSLGVFTSDSVHVADAKTGPNDNTAVITAAILEKSQEVKHEKEHLLTSGHRLSNAQTGCRTLLHEDNGCEISALKTGILEIAGQTCLPGPKAGVAEVKCCTETKDSKQPVDDGFNTNMGVSPGLWDKGSKLLDKLWNIKMQKDSDTSGNISSKLLNVNVGSAIGKDNRELPKTDSENEFPSLLEDQSDKPTKEPSRTRLTGLTLRKIIPKAGMTTPKESKGMKNSEYVNLYAWGEKAAAAAAILSNNDAHVEEGRARAKRSNIAEQTQAFSQVFGWFEWPGARSGIGVRDAVAKERCGWCYHCKVVSLRRGCLIHLVERSYYSAGRLSGGFGTPLIGNRRETSLTSSIRTGMHLSMLVRYVLRMEENLHGLLSSQWEQAKWRKNWRMMMVDKKNLADLKKPILELGNSLRSISLSVDWNEATEDAPLFGRKKRKPSSSVASSSTRRGSRRRSTSRRSKIEKLGGFPVPVTSIETLLWWRTHGLAGHAMDWEMLSQKELLKAARQGGIKRIPGLVYETPGGAFPQRTLKYAWSTRVEAARTVAQLALQIRALDGHIRWQDLYSPARDPVSPLTAKALETPGNLLGGSVSEERTPLGTPTKQMLTGSVETSHGTLRSIPPCLKDKRVDADGYIEYLYCTGQDDSSEEDEGSDVNVGRRIKSSIQVEGREEEAKKRGENTSNFAIVGEGHTGSEGGFPVRLERLREGTKACGSLSFYGIGQESKESREQGEERPTVAIEVVQNIAENSSKVGQVEGGKGVKVANGDESSRRDSVDAYGRSLRKRGKERQKQEKAESSGGRWVSEEVPPLYLVKEFEEWRRAIRWEVEAAAERAAEKLAKEEERRVRERAKLEERTKKKEQRKEKARAKRRELKQELNQKKLEETLVKNRQQQETETIEMRCIERIIGDGTANISAHSVPSSNDDKRICCFCKLAYDSKRFDCLSCPQVSSKWAPLSDIKLCTRCSGKYHGACLQAVVNAELGTYEILCLTCANPPVSVMPLNVRPKKMPVRRHAMKAISGTAVQEGGNAFGNNVVQSSTHQNTLDVLMNGYLGKVNGAEADGGREVESELLREEDDKRVKCPGDSSMPEMEGEEEILNPRKKRRLSKPRNSLCRPENTGIAKGLPGFRKNGNGFTFWSEGESCAMEELKTWLIRPGEWNGDCVEAPKCQLCDEDYDSKHCYIRCSTCPRWFHTDTLGLFESDLPHLRSYRCHKCRKQVKPGPCLHSLKQESFLSGLKKRMPAKSSKKTSGPEIVPVIKELQGPEAGAEALQSELVPDSAMPFKSNSSLILEMGTNGQQTGQEKAPAFPTEADERPHSTRNRAFEISPEINQGEIIDVKRDTKIPVPCAEKGFQFSPTISKGIEGSLGQSGPLQRYVESTPAVLVGILQQFEQTGGQYCRPTVNGLCGRKGGPPQGFLLTTEPITAPSPLKMPHNLVNYGMKTNGLTHVNEVGVCQRDENARTLVEEEQQVVGYNVLQNVKDSHGQESVPNQIPAAITPEFGQQDSETANRDSKSKGLSFSDNFEFIVPKDACLTSFGDENALSIGGPGASCEATGTGKLGPLLIEEERSNQEPSFSEMLQDDLEPLENVVGRENMKELHVGKSEETGGFMGSIGAGDLEPLTSENCKIAKGLTVFKSPSDMLVLQEEYLRGLYQLPCGGEDEKTESRQLFTVQVGGEEKIEPLQNRKEDVVLEDHENEVLEEGEETSGKRWDFDSGIKIVEFNDSSQGDQERLEGSSGACQLQSSKSPNHLNDGFKKQNLIETTYEKQGNEGIHDEMEGSRGDGGLNTDRGSDRQNYFMQSECGTDFGRGEGGLKEGKLINCEPFEEEDLQSREREKLNEEMTLRILPVSRNQKLNKLKRKEISCNVVTKLKDCSVHTGGCERDKGETEDVVKQNDFSLEAGQGEGDRQRKIGLETTIEINDRCVKSEMEMCERTYSRRQCQKQGHKSVSCGLVMVEGAVADTNLDEGRKAGEGKKTEKNEELKVFKRRKVKRVNENTGQLGSAETGSGGHYFSNEPELKFSGSHGKSTCHGNFQVGSALLETRQTEILSGEIGGFRTETELESCKLVNINSPRFSSPTDQRQLSIWPPVFSKGKRSRRGVENHERRGLPDRVSCLLKELMGDGDHSCVQAEVSQNIWLRESVGRNGRGNRGERLRPGLRRISQMQSLEEEVNDPIAVSGSEEEFNNSGNGVTNVNISGRKMGISPNNTSQKRGNTSTVKILSHGPRRRREACAVCGLGNSIPELVCSLCEVVVHRQCYEWDKGQEKEEGWECDACRAGVDVRHEICPLCPVKGGALKQTAEMSWVHAVCAFWTPETFVGPTGLIVNLDHIPKENWRRTCNICGIKRGAPISCSFKGCKSSFHPLCNRNQGWPVLSVRTVSGGPKYEAFCHEHVDHL